MPCKSLLIYSLDDEESFILLNVSLSEEYFSLISEGNSFAHRSIIVFICIDNILMEEGTGQ